MSKEKIGIQELTDPFYWKYVEGKGMPESGELESLVASELGIDADEARRLMDEERSRKSSGSNRLQVTSNSRKAKECFKGWI